MADDPDRELAMRRADLEREFDAKLKDLRAQEKRRADRLKTEQEEWERFRRAKQQELADREEKLRRNEQNTAKRAEAKQATQHDVSQLARRVEEMEKARREERAAYEALEQRLIRSERSSRSARSLLLATCIVALAGSAAWLVVAIQDGGPVAWAVATLVAAVALNLARLRTVRAARPRA